MIKTLITNSVFIAVLLGVYYNIGVVVGFTWVATVFGLIFILISLYLKQDSAYLEAYRAQYKPSKTLLGKLLPIVRSLASISVFYATERYNLMVVFITTWLLALYFIQEIKND